MLLADECPEMADVSGGGGDWGTLICSLPKDHGGPHYDDTDDITWQRGKPDDL